MKALEGRERVALEAEALYCCLALTRHTYVFDVASVKA